MAPVEFAAAIETRNRAFDPPRARKFLPAARTSIKETPGAALDRKRQGMTARFIGDAEIMAGLPPFRAMGRHATAAGAELREQMRELMAQGALDLGGVVFAQARIQRDKVAAEISAARGAEKPRIPLYPDLAREIGGLESAQNFACLRFEGGIASEHDERRPGRKDQF
jgi:hypothetical protein